MEKEIKEKKDVDVEEKKSHPIRNTFIILILLAGGLLLWSRYISTSGLIVKEYNITNEQIPESFHGFKIIHFSDLHYGRTIDDDDVEHMVETINSYKPEIVVFTGDLIDKDVVINDSSIEKLIEILSKIDPTIAKYSVKGNHDYETKGYDDIIEKAGFITLNNEKTEIFYKGEKPIELIGFPSSIQDHLDTEKAFGINEEELTQEEAEEIINNYRIVLIHEPDNVDLFSNYNVDLMLSGHSHGGQVRLPIIGAIVKAYGAANYYDEYYKVHDTDLYISSGLGVSTFNFRFMNKPSINLYRLYSH